MRISDWSSDVCSSDLSKAANILFAVEFDRRHKGRGIRAAAVHPGSIQTELVRHFGEGTLDKMVEEMGASLLAQGKGPFEWKTVSQGAATSIWAAVVAPAETRSEESRVGKGCVRTCRSRGYP